MKKPPFWAWSSVPSPRDEAQRSCVGEAMVTTDFMRSLQSRGLKVIWAQHRTGRAKWAAVHSLVLFTFSLSHIIATRVGLDLSCMICIFKKFIDRYDQTTGTTERHGSI